LADAVAFEEHEDANHLLWDLVRKHAVPAAGRNSAIDAAAFGPQAAVYILEARQADALGEVLRRDQLLETASEVATVTGCGGGSCGIQKLSASEEKDTKGLLGTKPGEKTAKDTERPCVKCGEKSVVYAWDERTKGPVKKGCRSCGATEGVKQGRKDKKKKSLFALAA
jgi:hypothetical protein